VSSTVSSRTPHLTAVLRQSERVTPLELFFDLVFVLALTQCTALIAGALTWEGVLKGLLVLGMLWWSWGGYAWLTSTVDPEEGSVRLAMFAAMAAFLVAALCVPQAFGSKALLFACAYAVVRIAHIALYMLASRDDPALRRAVLGLAVTSAVGTGLLVVAAFTGGGLQIGIWGLALVLDVGGPFVSGGEGWTLVPGHSDPRPGRDRPPGCGRRHSRRAGDGRRGGRWIASRGPVGRDRGRKRASDRGVSVRPRPVSGPIARGRVARKPQAERVAG
jgi:low temperature requirement protein LtrA